VVRRLLAERFGLVAHRETRPKPVYALIVDKKGLKLNPVKPPGTMEDAIRNPPHSFVRLRIEGRIDRLQMDGTETLDEIARALRLDRPVVNMTGIPGRFDYAIDAMIPAASGPPFILANGSVIPQSADDTPGLPGSIFTEIRKLGLVLDPQLRRKIIENDTFSVSCWVDSATGSCRNHPSIRQPAPRCPCRFRDSQIL
jgi:uncharacterized protein (TIGR03435 family)